MKYYTKKINYIINYIFAKCKYNKQCNSTYKLTIPSFPSDKENYVKVIVQRFFHHHHEGKKD
jgi:hypothetical protein